MDGFFGFGYPLMTRKISGERGGGEMKMNPPPPTTTTSRMRNTYYITHSYIKRQMTESKLNDDAIEFRLSLSLSLAI